MALPDADVPTATDSRIPSDNAWIAQGVLGSSFPLLPEGGVVVPDGRARLAAVPHLSERSSGAADFAVSRPQQPQGPFNTFVRDVISRWMMCSDGRVLYACLEVKRTPEQRTGHDKSRRVVPEWGPSVRQRYRYLSIE